jgi:hypothetical protein
VTFCRRDGQEPKMEAAIHIGANSGLPRDCREREEKPFRNTSHSKDFTLQKK